MGSRPQNSSSSRMRRARRKSSNQKADQVISSTDDNNYSSISEKLEALKQLLPVNNGDLKADQLFKETADYIVLLRTQVFVLQKLLDFYDNGSGQSQDNNHSNAV
ncbi:hypothetical protein RND71_034147 [Anisodus tanguticus]|uniref:Uncharacterized protein n=1 Tax=Anisodus tanguticus TaxID=243964 RepID=A0AAE1RAT5_9SOLA|nr:hypothetical protein RND71_034147 [Anisodus tanguticus]